MSTSDFLARVLGEDGFYCLFGANASTNRRIQKFYPDIDRLISAAHDLDANGFDSYFALATFETDESRTKDNAKQLRALFLDLDCGANKDFPDQNTAITELRKFCRDVGLPKPFLVNSGRGVHVYWPLDVPASLEEWLPVANKLKRCCAAADFGADPAVTSDAARVLRVPATHNHKSDPPAPVELLGVAGVQSISLSDMESALDNYAGRITGKKSDGLFVPTPAQLPRGNALMDRLTGNKQATFRMILQKTQKGQGCAQLLHALTNQAEIDEPLWRAALSIAKFCEDGDKAAHKLSCEHPEYDPETTENKLRAIKGPYTCSKFDEYNPGGCEGCPHFGKIKSPIVLGQQVIEAAPEDNVVEAKTNNAETVEVHTIPDYPKPYFRGKLGGVYIREVQDDPDELPREVCVYPNDFYMTKRVYDLEYGEMALVKLHLPRDGVRAFPVALTDMSSRDKLREALSKQGVVTSHPKQWDTIMSYASTWISHLQANTEADETRRQFGWTSDKMESFILGDREIFGDRVIFNVPSGATAPFAKAFTPKGTLEGWVKQAEFYNREGMEAYQFKLGHTLGSVLMRMHPVYAGVFAFYSDGSGHGKTTTQEFAMSAFGEPRPLMFSKKDTVNAKMNRMELYKDLPVEFDETTNMTAQDMSDLVYGAYEGMQKNRMSGGSNAERIRGEAWKLTVGMSANVSPISRIMEAKSMPKGEIQRVLEYHVRPYQFADKNETDQFAAEVGKNSGHVAEPFIQFIINNRAEVKAMMDAVQADIDKRAGLTHQNRFWSITAAVGIVALVICRKLGFVQYDIKRLTSWIVDVIIENKTRDLETTINIENIVNEYVTDNYSNILWIKSTEDRRGEASHGSGLDSLVVPEHEPRGRLVGRYETDLKRLYLIPKPFRAWCARQQLNYDSVLAEIMTKMKGQKRKVRISKGTKLNLPAADAVILDCSQIDIDVEAPDGGTED